MAKKYYSHPINCIDLFREEYEFLSNFYHAKMLFDGIAYDNAESAYQAQKLSNPSERLQFKHLYGDEAKRMGQKVIVRPDWDDVKLDLMRDIVFAKFTQNPRLANLLIETGNIPIYEGNRWGDTYWGISLTSREGENHLGEILMDLRFNLQQEGIPASCTYHPVRWFGPANNIYVTDEDITQLDFECIVNPVDMTMLGGGSLATDIFHDAGQILRNDCRKFGLCDVGTAEITPGYNLQSRYIIHAACPVYKKDDENLLMDCYSNCLDLAKANDIHSIAFPMLSTGRFCFPKDKATHIAVDAIHRWLQNEQGYDMKVVLSCIDYRIYDMACKIVTMYK